MATLEDIGVSAGINILSAFIFFIIFAVLRLQPFNDRVYFSKWYLKRIRSSPARAGAFVQRFVNLDLRSYLKFFHWMPEALKMPEDELIDHAGLDSGLPGAPGMKVYSRDDIEKYKNIPESMGNEDDDEDEDEDEKFPKNLGKVLKEEKSKNGEETCTESVEPCPKMGG